MNYFILNWEEERRASLRDYNYIYFLYFNILNDIFPNVEMNEKNLLFKFRNQIKEITLTAKSNQSVEKAKNIKRIGTRTN